jgi:hypothetical protein
MNTLLLKAVGLLVLSGLATTAHEPPSAVQETPQLDLTGEYYVGDGLGFNQTLILKGDNTFEFLETGCGGIYDQSKGAFTFDNDQITLRPSEPQKDKHFATKTMFYPVKWADRLYLVADDEMLEFASKYAMGWRGEHYDGRSGSHYLRNGIDDNLTQPVQGKPQIPDEYKRYLTRPFQADITAVNGREVTIDQGSDAGLFPGTQLRLRERQTVWMTVKKSSPTTATCLLEDQKDKVKPGERVMIAVYGFF